MTWHRTILRLCLCPIAASNMVCIQFLSYSVMDLNFAELSSGSRCSRMILPLFFARRKLPYCSCWIMLDRHFVWINPFQSCLCGSPQLVDQPLLIECGSPFVVDQPLSFFGRVDRQLLWINLLFFHGHYSKPFTELCSFIRLLSASSFKHIYVQ